MSNTFCNSEKIFKILQFSGETTVDLPKQNNIVNITAKLFR